MQLKDILRLTQKELVKLELWETDRDEYKTLTFNDEEFNKYLDYEVAEIIPIVFCYNNAYEDRVVVKPKLKICIDLFD